MPQRAFRLLFLAQDIAEDDGDLAGLVIARCGKALCLFRLGETIWSKQEYATARTLLDQLLVANADIVNRRVIMQFGHSLSLLRSTSADRLSRAGGSFPGKLSRLAETEQPGKPVDRALVTRLMTWEFRARLEVALAALTVALTASDDGVRHTMANAAQRLFAGVDAWPKADMTAQDNEMGRMPIIYRLVTEGFRQALLDPPSGVESFRRCMKLAQQDGFFREALLCLYLMEMMCGAKSAETSREFAFIAEHSQIDWRRDIAEPLERRLQPFEVQLRTYVAPYDVAARASKRIYDSTTAYMITHLRGEQGYDEEVVMERIIRAPTAFEAIVAIAPSEHAARWTPSGEGDETAALFNPAIRNASESYVDYWYAERLG